MDKPWGVDRFPRLVMYSASMSVVVRRNLDMEKSATDQPSWLELERIMPIGEVAKLNNLSDDTIKRRHADKIVQLSPRRIGMKVRDALAIGKGNTA
jgi:hypothetical protein